MMKIQFRYVLCTAVAVALFSLQAAQAGTIMKLSLGSDAAPDYQFSGGVGGVMSTINDGVGGTPGDQDTAVEFLDFLTSFPNIPAGASYTLSGMTAAGPAQLGPGTFVFQNLTGGTFQLWDDLNQPLLNVALGDSVIVGQTGNSSGATISTTLGTPLGGPLAPYIVPGTVGISIALSDVTSSGVPGLTVTLGGPGGPTLNAFTADASKTVLGEPTGIPEPASALLVALGLVGVWGVRRR